LAINLQLRLVRASVKAKSHFFAQGQAEDLLDPAHQGQRGLHRDRVGVDEEIGEQPVILQVQRARLGPAPGQAVVDEIGHRRGATLEATLITPTAPTIIMGRVSESSPDSTSIAQRVRIWLTRSTLPPASLMATTCGCFANLDHDVHRDFLPGAAGHVVEHHGQAEVGHRGKMADEAQAVGLVVVRGDLERAVGPASLAWRVSSSASAVELPPVPAMILTRRRAVSMATSMTFSCSLKSTVGDSPVVPTGTKPSTPPAIWNSIKSRNAHSPPGRRG
jgi:hypothetical protein